ncbi:MAG TPA: mechanosensitive ion channel family protein [Burkholderiales bacterium]|nr:mechanosensitive ion channel family protein [Burkholderiales bacterium]
MGEQLNALDRMSVTAIDLAVRFGPKLLVAIVILAAGVFAARWAGRAVQSGLAKLEPPARALAERIVQVLVLGLFVVMALQNLGVELLPLIAGLGIAGAGIALAMQGVLGNVVAGLTIIFTRPFRVGDYISIVGEEGEVLEVRLFSTTLGHPDLSRVVIPNRKIVGEILHNYGGIRQIPLDLVLAHDTDMKALAETVGAALGANPRVLADPVPVVRVLRLTELGIVVRVAPWVKVADYGDALGAVNQALLEGLRREGIALAVPQREIRAAIPLKRADDRLAGRDAA